MKMVMVMASWSGFNGCRIILIPPYIGICIRIQMRFFHLDFIATSRVDTFTSCCASCGIAEVDNVKLKECDDCDLAPYCSDISVREIIYHSTKRRARKELLNFVMSSYSSNLKARILGTVRSACYLCCSIEGNAPR